GAGARHARLDAREARKVQVRLRRIADSRTLLGYLRDSIEQLEALVGEIRRIACGPVRAERRQHFDGKVATGQSDALCALADVTVRDSRSSRSTACEIERLREANDLVVGVRAFDFELDLRVEQRPGRCAGKGLLACELRFGRKDL